MWEKFNKYDVMKANDKSNAPPDGQVRYKCTERGCNKTFTTKGGLRQHIRHHEGGTKHVMFVEKCFILIVCYQRI